MSTPYTPPGTDPTGYPGPQPQPNRDAADEPVKPLEEGEETE